MGCGGATAATIPSAWRSSSRSRGPTWRGCRKWARSEARESSTIPEARSRRSPVSPTPSGSPSCAAGIRTATASSPGSPSRRAGATTSRSRGAKRGCLRADVDLGTFALHVFNCHLGLDARERRRQAAQLLSADILRDTALSYPLVLVGDFNAWSSRSAVPRWIRRQLADAAVLVRSTRATFPAVFPLFRLDRAYVGPAVRVLSCEVHDSHLARLASDHLPLVAEVELDPSVARRPPPARAISGAGVTTQVEDEEGPSARASR